MIYNAFEFRFLEKRFIEQYCPAESTARFYGEELAYSVV